ncbi:hypothetical protein [Bartonella sp. B39]
MKIFQKIALYIVTIAFFFSQILEANAYYLSNHSQNSNFTSISIMSEEKKVVKAINMVMDYISTQRTKQGTEQDVKEGVIKVEFSAILIPALWGLIAYFAYFFSRKPDPSRKLSQRTFDAFMHSAWALT